MQLHEILCPERSTAVVDVGAAYIDTLPPYHALQEAGLCTVIGFEPQTELWPPQTPNNVTFPDVIGDGKRVTLNIWNAPGMTGVFEPNKVFLQATDPTSAGGTSWGEILKKIEMPTRRLDDIEQIEVIDFLKIDAQGSELAVLKGAAQKLSNAVCVQAEMCFVPLYIGQPLFRDIDVLLAKFGFVFHSFAEVHARTILPLTGRHGMMHQIIHADSVYVRDFSRINLIPSEQLKHMATIAAYCYQSVHLAYRCVDELVRRGCVSKAAVSECFFPKSEQGWWTEK